MTTNTTQSANPSLYKTLRYEPLKDFTPIVLTGELPFALVVNNDLPVKNLKEFLAYVRANPGKVSYATPNSTSLVGLAPGHKRCLHSLGVLGSPVAITTGVSADKAQLHGKARWRGRIAVGQQQERTSDDFRLRRVQTRAE